MAKKRGATEKPLGDGPQPSLAMADPWAHLAAGVLANAARQAKAGDANAAHWLAGEEAAWYLEALGLDTQAAGRFARSVSAETVSDVPGPRQS